MSTEFELICIMQGGFLHVDAFNNIQRNPEKYSFFYFLLQISTQIADLCKWNHISLNLFASTHNIEYQD